MTEDSRPEYVRAVLAAYVALADTPDRPRPADRALAAQLYDRQIPLNLVRDALILAYARRTLRPPDAPPLQPVRSLYYFMPVIDELLKKPLPNMYIDYLKAKLKRGQLGECSKNRVSS